MSMRSCMSPKCLWTRSYHMPENVEKTRTNVEEKILSLRQGCLHCIRPIFHVLDLERYFSFDLFQSPATLGPGIWSRYQRYRNRRCNWTESYLQLEAERGNVRGCATRKKTKARQVYLRVVPEDYLGFCIRRRLKLDFSGRFPTF